MIEIKGSDFLKKVSPAFKVVKKIIKTVYPRIEVVGVENLPDGPAIIVGNHSQVRGPLISELYFPGDRYTWCAGEMMKLREVPEYAFKDFWSQKPRNTHPYFKLMSYLIAPISAFLFGNADTIPVYHDARVLTTFRDSVKYLQEGADIIIFPEHNVEYNNIIYDFQERFIDTARFYHKRTGEELSFVPMYIAPFLKKMYIGKPIRFCAENSMDEERARIRKYLMDEITEMARALPLHTVVPYRNIGRRNYPKNKEVQKNEKTDG